MSKLGLIIRREYLTRVTKKSFIIGTLLAPLGLLIYMLVIVGLTKYESGGQLTVALLDEAGMVKQVPDDKSIRYIPSAGKTLDQLKEEVKEKKIDGVLRIPALGNFQKKDHTIFYYSDDKLAPEKSGAIEEKIAGKIRDFKIDSLRLDRKSLETLDTDISIDPESLSGTEDEVITVSAAELSAITRASITWEDVWYGYRLHVNKRDGAPYFRDFWEMFLAYGTTD